MSVRQHLFICLVSFAFVCRAGDHTTVASLNEALRHGPCEPVSFSLHGHVLDLNTSKADTIRDAFSHKGVLTLEDETGRISLMCQMPDVPSSGCLITATGTAWVAKSLDTFVYAKTAAVIGRKPLPPPANIALRDLSEKRHDLLLIRSRGTVIDVFRDEIDPETDFLLVKDGDTILPLACRHETLTNDLNDAYIEFTGRYHKSVSGKRKYSGPFVMLQPGNGVTVLEAPPPDRLLVPDLEYVNSIAPSEIAALGKRRLSGVVLAAWQQSHLMVRSDDGRIVMVTLARGNPLPPVHAHVTVAGWPQTDLFRINLTRAICRTDGERQTPPDDIADLTGKPFAHTTAGKPLILDQFCGTTVRLRGLVKNVPLPHAERNQLTLARDDFLIAIDPGVLEGAFDDVPVGSEIEVTGVCVIETETWQPHLIFPHATGSLLVLRTPDDIRVLTRPPWWTPSRLLLVIGSLLAALVGVVVWNRSLDCTVRRRTKALVREQLATTAASLKIDERTRLAAELHDSLSQNLSAVAFQLSAAKSTADGNAETLSLLATAERMLQSSRMELTRCLWDLRGDALEEANFTRAIENTLARLALKAKTIIRFNVPRERVDDTTAHAIICIVRELVTNAVKHGGADEIRIAGETHEDTISFSVRDNGTGFNPECVRGIAEGHFGLEGIRDRISRLDGTFEIKSGSGAGTKATVNLKMKRESTGNEFKA